MKPKKRLYSFPMKTPPPISSFMPDRTAVIGGSNEIAFGIFILYSRPNGSHGRLA
jgi:hypothetical protein